MDSENVALTSRTATIRVGVVIRKQPGVTRWAKWVWRAVAVLPGAGDADWVEMRRDGEAVEYHAATLDLEVHRKETEGYRVSLSNDPPSVYVILRPSVLAKPEGHSRGVHDQSSVRKGIDHKGRWERVVKHMVGGRDPQFAMCRVDCPAT